MTPTRGPSGEGLDGASQARAWLLAARPKTLAAAFVPVAVGTAVAWDLVRERPGDAFDPAAALVCLLTALLLQVGTNFANDYYDFVHGADTEERVGPTRAVQAGLVTPAAMRAATAVVFGLAFVGGLYLAWVAGWPLVVIGVTSVAAGIGYTAGGRYSIGYLGLGDLFVFVFFGLVAVAGTVYVQVQRWAPEAFQAAVPVGCLAVAVLVVNNYRDADTDAASGKRTLAVRFGRGFARAEYFALLAVAFAVPTLQWWTGVQEPWVLLTWLSAPLAWPPLRKLLAPVDAPDLGPNLGPTLGSTLNRALGETARLMLAFGTLYAVGIVL